MGALARKIEKQGIEKGEKQSKYKIAKSMLLEGLNLQFTVKLTGLNKEELVQLN
jgi:hypothetical protein